MADVDPPSSSPIDFGSPPRDPAPPSNEPAFPRPAPPPPPPPRPAWGGPPPPPPPSPRKQGRSWSFWLAIVATILLVMSVGMNFLLMLAVAMGGSGGVDKPQNFREKVIEGSGLQKIAVIEVNGVITSSNGMFGGGTPMSETVMKQLKQAADDPFVKAVVLSINSPGGEVTASDEILNEVKKVQKAGKKVVVHMGALCASGGVYISASADSLIASPTTITGSIGVIFSLMNAQELMENKLGIRETPVKSGEFKDIGSMSRVMRPEERAIFQSLVDDAFNRFVTLIAEGRVGKKGFEGDLDATKAAIRKLADGRVYTADQALAHGLVDKLGYIDDAYAEAKRLTKLSDAKIVRYVRAVGFSEAFFGAEGKVTINAGVQIDASGLGRPMPMMEYRWAP